jgi:hypothetical protein
MARAAYSVAMSNPVLKKQLMNTSHAGPVKNVSYTQKGFNKGDDWYNGTMFTTIVRLGCPIPDSK